MHELNNTYILVLFGQMLLLAIFSTMGIATGYITYSPIIMLYLIVKMANTFGMGLNKKIIKWGDRVYTSILLILFFFVVLWIILTPAKNFATFLIIFVGIVCVIQVIACRKLTKAGAFARLITKIGRASHSNTSVLFKILIISSIVYLSAIIFLQRSLTIEGLLGLTAPLVLLALLYTKGSNDYAKRLNNKVLGFTSISLTLFLISLMLLSLNPSYFNFYAYHFTLTTLCMLIYNAINIFSFIAVGVINGVIRPALEHSNTDSK